MEFGRELVCDLLASLTVTIVELTLCIMVHIIHGPATSAVVIASLA